MKNKKKKQMASIITITILMMLELTGFCLGLRLGTDAIIGISLIAFFLTLVYAVKGVFQNSKENRKEKK